MTEQLVNCPRCRGFGEREQWVYANFVSDPTLETFVCDVCGGTGKIDLLLDAILSEEPDDED